MKKKFIHSSKSSSGQARSRGGFTLIEIMIAIAMTAVLLGLAVGILGNVVALREQSGDIGRLDRHVAGIERFLNRIIDAQNTSLGKTSNGSDIIGVNWSPPPDDTNAHLPSFTISENFPLFRAIENPQPTLSAWLRVEKKSLFLIVQTPRMKKDNPENVVPVELSPWLEEMRVLIFDPSTNIWETANTLDNTTLKQKLVRVILVFKKEKITREITLALSRTTPGGMRY